MQCACRLCAITRFEDAQHHIEHWPVALHEVPQPLGHGEHPLAHRQAGEYVFDRQDAAYREAVLPKACRKRVAIEAGVSDFWRNYVGLDGAVVGIDSFGASAPIEALLPRFGFTVAHLIEVIDGL